MSGQGRPKLGLAFGGGGIRGMAHIGLMSSWINMEFGLILFPAPPLVPALPRFMLAATRANLWPILCKILI